jgi:hypothetical protein
VQKPHNYNLLKPKKLFKSLEQENANPTAGCISNLLQYLYLYWGIYVHGETRMLKVTMPGSKYGSFLSEDLCISHLPNIPTSYESHFRIEGISKTSLRIKCM